MLLVQRIDDLIEIVVYRIEAVGQHVSRRAGAIGVAARVTKQMRRVGCGRAINAGGISCVVGELLANTDGLVVGAEHGRDTLSRLAVGGQSVNLGNDPERLEVV